MMIKDKSIEEYLKYWMIKLIYCKDMEHETSVGLKKRC